MGSCNHKHFYFLSGRAMCLHEMFEGGYVQAITKEKNRYGDIEFCIWRNKLVKQTKGRYAGTYITLGPRSKLRDRETIIYAVDLAKKHNIQRINL